MDKLSVLVIEDDEMNTVLFKELLVLNGCEVSIAADAETGIDIARKSQPDVILMDVQLPGMDGLSATKVIQRDDELKGVPIIALTAHAMSGDKDKAYAAGCVGYITKPVNTRTFYKEIITSIGASSKDGE